MTMSREPVNMPSTSEKAPPDSGSTGKKGSSVMMARVLGILCVAAGFLLGIHGLDHPGSPMLPTALGMIVTGLVAQVFALVRACYLGSQGKG
jgi:quinol-cytochrome oxidoreductase complex cytochrome b subunit